MARRRKYNSDYNSDKGMYSKDEYERKYSQGGNSGYSMQQFAQRFNSGIYDEHRRQWAEEEELRRHEAEQRRIEQERLRNAAMTKMWQDETKKAQYTVDPATGRVVDNSRQVYMAKQIHDTPGAYERWQEEQAKKQRQQDSYMSQRYPREEIMAEKKARRAMEKYDREMQEWMAAKGLNYDGLKDIRAKNNGNGTSYALTVDEWKEWDDQNQENKAKGLLDNSTEARYVSDQGLDDWTKRYQKKADEYNVTPGELWANAHGYRNELEEKRLRTRKPANYEEAAEEYNRDLYNAVNGEGTYERRVDSLQTDTEAERLDAELAELWARYERGELPDYLITSYFDDDTEEKLNQLQSQAEEQKRNSLDAGNRYFDFGTQYNDWANMTPEERRNTLWLDMTGEEYAEATAGMTPEELDEMNRRMDLVIGKAMYGTTKDYNQAAEAYEQKVKEGQAEKAYRENIGQYNTQAEELAAQGYTGEGIAEDLEANKPKYVIADENDPEGSLVLDHTWTETEKALYTMNHPHQIGGTENLYSEANKYMFANEEQVKQANIFYEYDLKNGTHLTEAFLEGIDHYLTSRLSSYQEMYARSYAEKPVANVIGRVVSYPAKILSGAAGTAGTLAAVAGVESAKDTTSGWYKWDRFITNFRDQENENIAEAMESVVKGSKGWTKFALGVADSILDNVTAMYVGGKLSAGSRDRTMKAVQAIMSFGATSNTMIEKLESGMDPTMAAIYAIGDGVIEAITEKYSLEELLKPDVKAMLGNGKAIRIFLAKNTIAEGSEEVASDLLNMGLDSLLSFIGGHNDELTQAVNDLIVNDNMTATEATKKVLQDKLGEIAMSGLAGAMSGFIMSGGRYEINKISQAQAGKNVQANKNVQRLLDVGLGMKEDTQSRALAEQLLENKNAGKQTSNVELGRLAQLMTMETSEEQAGVIRETMTNTIRQELQEKGVENPDQYAEVISRNLFEGNERLSKADRSTLAQSSEAIDLWAKYNSNVAERFKLEMNNAKATAGQQSVINTISDLTSARARSSSVLAAEIERSIRETGSAAEAIDNLQQRSPNLLSERYSQKAKELLESDPEAKKNTNYLDDVMKIRLAAMSLAKGAPETRLSKETAQALFEEARAEFDEFDKTRLKNQAKVVPGQGIFTLDGAEYGTDDFTEKTKGYSRKLRNQLGALGEVVVRMGNNVKVVDDPDMVGVYGYETGTGAIVVNVHNHKSLSHSMLATMAHEMTHWLEQNSWEGYNQLRQYAVDQLRAKGENVEQLLVDKILNIDAARAKAQEAGNTAEADMLAPMDMNGAMADLVAQSCENLLASKNFRDEIAKTNPSLYNKIRNYVKNFVARLSAAVKELTGNQLHYEARQLLDQTEQIAKLWLGARQEALGREVTGELEAESDISFSLIDKNGNEYTLTEEQIKENKNTVSVMPIVSTVNENRFAKGEDGDFKSRAVEYVNSINNKAENSILGEIVFDIKGIEHLISNLTARRAGLLPAVKNVIEKGKIVDIAVKGQRHSFDSAVIAAPVIYIGKTYYMGVVIKQSVNETSYYMHDAILAIQKDGASPVIKSLLNQATGGAPSIANILQSIPKYNGENGITGTINIDKPDIRWSVEEGTKKGSLTAAADPLNPALTSETTNGITSEDIVAQDEDPVKRAREEELDQEYMQAILDGDVEKQLKMIREKYSNTEGIYPFYSAAPYKGRAIQISKRIKNGDMAAISIAAYDMAKYVPDNAVLIPMPGHEGVVTDNTDTMLLAKELGRITGKPVISALEGNSRESRYKAKLENRKGVTAEEMGFRQVQDLPDGTIPIIIDNVVSFGETAKAAINAIPGGSVLSYTKGKAENVVKGLKAAFATKDENKNYIPLSKKGDINNPNWRFSVEQSPDMEVDRFMLGLNEESLGTLQEKTMLRQYKDLHMTTSILNYKIRDREAQLKKLQQKQAAQGGKLSAYDREEMRKINIRLNNDRTRLDKVQNELVKVTKDKGYARLMMQQDSLMKNLVRGVTADQLISLVENMSRQLDEVNKAMQERAGKLQELSQKEAVLRIRSQFNRTGLKQIAARLKAEMNSQLENREIENRLALIALKMKEGKFDSDTTQELTDLILGKMRGGYDSYVLSTLRGRKIALSPAQLKELKARNMGLREINAELAGTGIRFTNSGNTNLEQMWGDLCDEISSLNRDENALQQLDALMDVIRTEKEIAFSDRFNDQSIQGTTEAVMKAAAQLVPEIVTDEKGLDQIKEVLRFVQEISGQAAEGAAEISDMTAVINRLKQTGKAAASGANKLTGDINTAIDYFNTLAEQSEAAMWKRERLALIDQLKSENTQNLMAEQAKWKEKIEKDKTARQQMESNLQLRKKITTNVSRIRKLLINESDIKNIPEHMKGLARTMLEKIVDNDLAGRKVSGIDRKDLIETKRVLDAMKEMDGEFTLDDLKLLHDEEVQSVVADALADLEDGLGFYNKRATGSLLTNLQAFRNALEKISDAVSTITSVINAERSVNFLDRRIDLADAAEDIRKDMDKSRFKGDLIGRGSKAVKAVSSAVFYGNMTPVYFFKMLRNGGMNAVWQDMQKGENRSGLETQKARARLAQLAEKTGYRNWNEEKHDVLLGGQKRKISIENMMELYAIWKREQTTNPEMSQHLTKGGIFIQEEEDNTGRLRRENTQQRAIRVTDEEIQAMYGQMTDAQKEYLEGIVSYLSNEMSELGNEASMRMYGIKKYKESYYFPMKVWDGVKSARSDKGITGTDENRAAHRSWSKRRQHMAQNALVIGSFTKDAVNHIVEMINYNTMAPSIENVNKILNFQFTEGETEDDFTKRNLRIMFEEAYGKEALRYLETFMKDLNGGVTQDQRKTLRDRALTMFKKNAVAGSLSVALQQPLSYIRAAMMISPKYLTMGLSPAYWKGSYAEMLKHSGVAVIKDMGRFDMNFGQSAKDFITPETGKNAYETVSDALTKAPELMDRMTWTRMWSAVKAEQKALHPDMDVSSDAFLDMVGERFNELMRTTQVYDSIMVKSSNMRSQNFGMKLITSFMAEPTLSLNVLADAVGKVRAGDKGSIGHMAKAGATFLLSAILQAAVKGLMGSGRTPDDKKTWLENFLNKFQYNLQNEANPISLIPGYSDLIEVLKTGELKDDAMGALGKLFSIVQTGQKALQGNGKGAWRDLEDTVGQFVQLFTNIPAKNLSRDVRAIRNWILGDTYADRATSGNVIRYQTEANMFTADNLLGTLNAWLGDAGFITSNKAYYSRMYEAQKRGDTDTAEGIREYLTLGKGVKEDTIENSIKSMTKTDPGMTYEEKIKALRTRGSKDDDIAAWITKEYKEGRISRAEAEKLYIKANPKKTRDEAYFKFAQAEWEEKNKIDVDESEYFRLNDAMDKGSSSEYSKAINELLQHGFDEKKINNHVKDYILKKFKNDKASRQITINALKKFRSDMTDDDIFWTMDRLDYQKQTKKEDGVSGYYYRLTDAVNANKAVDIQQAVKELLAHGITKEKIKNKLSDWKSEYLAADSRQRIRIRDALEKAYKAAGYTATDADKVINRWIDENKKKNK